MIYIFHYNGEKIMKIDKVMNNNVVSSIDEDGQEIIVVGTGVGFQGKEGKPVDEKKIQKIFRLEDPKMIRKLKEIFRWNSLKFQQRSSNMPSKV